MTTFSDVIAVLGGSSQDSKPITGVSSSSDPRPQTLSFMTRWADDSQEIVDRHPTTLFLVPADAPLRDDTANAFPVERPRLAYALALRDVLHQDGPPTIASTAVVDESAVIGGHGFGFEMDDDGVPVRVGHRGGVVIGNDVEIGHQCSIAQGTIAPTRIQDHVKIDDCVFIAHNVQIGRSSYIIAGAEISGSVMIGERVWISPEVTVINKVSIGDDALVGIGAVVIKDVEANTVVAGVPAKPRGPRHA